MEIREKGRKGRGRTLLCILLVMLLSVGIAGCGTPAQEQTEQPEQAETESKGILTSAEEIGLQDTDGNGKEYVFYYNNIEFHARYTPDNWKISARLYRRSILSMAVTWFPGGRRRTWPMNGSSTTSCSTCCRRRAPSGRV